MKQLPLSILYELKEGKLVFKREIDKFKYDLYVKNLAEGDIIEVTHEEQSPSGSLAQLAKVHACIGELSKFLGYDKDELKDIVKNKAKLYTEDGEYKSFRDCTKEELSQAIEAVITIGQAVDFPLE
jgi:type IV secretory pathway VirB4 component